MNYTIYILLLFSSWLIDCFLKKKIKKYTVFSLFNSLVYPTDKESKVSKLCGSILLDSSKAKTAKLSLSVIA